jgi:NADPH-dependent curcumin reductase CurA
LFLTVAVGKVIQIGSSVKGFKIGDAIVSTTYNAFGDYIVISSKQAIKVPSTSPQAIPIFVSGLTASIALEQAGRIKKGETVLVTAAAGATGLFAVQLAKLAGCHVIGTCSSDEKCDYLLSLGVDRAINYTKVDLYKTLKSEYPKGIDVVYESVGGETFNVCVDNLAVKGRLIVIGFISGYKDGSGWTKEVVSKTPLPVKLLGKSTSVVGFFLNNYTSEWGRHMQQIQSLYMEGKLKIEVDKTKFYGLESVADAIDHLLSGKNIGKVTVSLIKDSKL